MNGDLQNSHIIPEFFYKLIYDTNPRRFRVISAIESEPERYEQKGLREYLLCRDCEQKLGRWEHYSKGAFVDASGVQITHHKMAVVFSNLDYKSFKLFLLSLLWRMSVSTLDFFKEVSLGLHEEKLRLALINEDPLRFHQYPCAMNVVEIDGKACSDWFVQPTLSRIDGCHVYSPVIAGILFNFYVGSQSVQPSGVSHVLNERGQMTLSVRQLRDIPFLIKFGRRLVQAQAARPKARS